MSGLSSERGITRTLWAVAIALLVFVCAWPALGGLMAVNDDIKFVRVPQHSEPLSKQVATAWRESPSFRPLELAVAASCDERTLRAPLAAPVQATGLVVLAFAIAALARIALPGQPWVAPIALAWVALSPATTCAAWQIDAGSQTWSAALGAWALVLAWRAFESARAGRTPWLALGLLTLVFALGVNIKETFYGWSAGVGLALIGACGWLLVRDRAAALRLSVTVLPVVALPIAHLGLRWLTGSMSRSLELKQENRYQLELGMNLVTNAAQSVAGAFGTGPFYLLADDKANALLRLLPMVAWLAELALLVTALEFVVLRPARERRLRWAPIATMLGAGLVSLAVTFPMGSVSELYGFGANVAVGVLLAVAVTALWRMPPEEDRSITRGVAGTCAALLLSVGVYGLVGRAHHFHRVWTCTRMANEQILQFMAKRPPAPRFDQAPLSAIYFPACCRGERSYSSYIMPVAQAIDIINTVEWMKRVDPKHPTTFSIDQDARNPTPYEMVVDCASMPPDSHW